MPLGLSIYVCNYYLEKPYLSLALTFSNKMSSLCPPFISPSVFWPRVPCAMPAVAAVAVATVVMKAATMVMTTAAVATVLTSVWQ